MLLLIPFISNKIYYNTLFSYIGYFFLTLFFLKVFNKKLSATSIAVIIFVAMFLLQFHTIYTWFVQDIFGIPAVATYCLGIISAYSYLKSKPPKNIILFSLSSCFVVFMFLQGWDYWIHRINFGTFTGKVEAYNLPTKFEAVDEEQNLISNINFKDKIVLLDFWTTTCGICFKKFPHVQAVYEKYKNDPSVMILAVNKPIEEDEPGKTFDMIKEEGHSFPVVITKDEDLAEKFGVNVYPTTFVINQNGQIVYKGGVESAIKMVDKLKSNSR